MGDNHEDRHEDPVELERHPGSQDPPKPKPAPAPPPEPVFKSKSAPPASYDYGKYANRSLFDRNYDSDFPLADEMPFALGGKRERQRAMAMERAANMGIRSLGFLAMEIQDVKFDRFRVLKLIEESQNQIQGEMTRF